MQLAIYIGGAVVFFAMVMASIALHEVGHLCRARFRRQATEYFVGFGRTLWSRRKGSRVRPQADPLGGYVRLSGCSRRPRRVPARCARTARGCSARWPTTPARPSGRTSGPRTTAGCSTRSRQAKVDHHGGRPDDEPAARVRDLPRGDGELRRVPVAADDHPGAGVIVAANAADQSCAGKPDPGRPVRDPAQDKIVAFNGRPVLLGRGVILIGAIGSPGCGHVERARAAD